MKTEIKETELYQKFKKALNITDAMSTEDNPFIVECCSIAQQEHTRKLEEAGKELRLIVQDYQVYNDKGELIYFLDSMLGRDIFSKASTLLASLQSKLMEEQINSNRILTAWEKQLEDIKQLQSQLEAKSKEVEELSKAYEKSVEQNLDLKLTTVSLRKELQEAKAEVERMDNRILEGLKKMRIKLGLFSLYGEKDCKRWLDDYFSPNSITGEDNTEKG